MDRKLEKNGFVLLSIEPDYLQRRDEVKKAVRGIGSEYYRIGMCESLDSERDVYGEHDMIVEVLSDGMAGTKLAAERMRNLEIDRRKPVRSTITMLLAGESTSVYHE